MKRLAVALFALAACGGAPRTTYDFAGLIPDFGNLRPDFAGLLPTDLSTNMGDDASANPHPDGGSSTDAAMAIDFATLTYTATTPHAVDTDVIGGALRNGAGVSMTGLIVLAPPSAFAAKITVSGDACRYEVFAQDTTCSTAPCGIILETQPITNPNGTGNLCPFADELVDANNFLHTTFTGDRITIKGVVDNFPHTGSAFDGGAMGSVDSHQIELVALTTTATAQTLPTPILITDSTPSIFTPYTGAGWAQYEGMYVKLQASNGKLSTTLSTSSTYTDACSGVTGKTNGSFTTAPGGAYFADTYASFYIDKDAGEATNCWPTNGSLFSSVSGIVSTAFGGSILPTKAADFAQ